MTAPLHILLIDDNRDDRALVAWALEREFPRVRISPILGPDDLDRALGGAFDVAVTDYRLGWSNGLEVLRGIRALSAEVPVVMFSGAAGEENVAQAFREGLDEYIEKQPGYHKLLPPAIRGCVERQHARSELAAAERRYRTLFDNVPVGLYRSTPTGQIIEANPALARMLGYENPAELKSIRAVDLYVEPEDRQRWQNQIALIGVVQGFETRLKHRNGNEVFVRASAKAVTDVDGNVLHYEGAVIDTSERRRVESLQQATLESTADGILIVDASGKISSTNQRFVELWRIPEEVLCQEDDEAALAFVLDQLEDPDGFLQKVRALYGDPRAESFDVLRFKDGRIFERYSRPQLIGGKPVGRIWSFRDVTARHRLEEQLRQATKLEAVGRLAGGVAHDFNNLLTAILGYSELLGTEFDDEGDPRAAQLAEIRKAALRGRALTRQLLAFSRKQVLRPQVLDLNESLRGIQEMFARVIGEDIRLEVELAERLDAVQVDPGQLEQVVLNLVVNARDAMPRGGTLRIVTDNVTLDEAYAELHVGIRPGRYVRLSVADTGSGIDDEARGKIFEPFFTTKEPGKGTGLGLSTVYGIVSQSGGHIDFESTHGHGSTFRIYLPRIDALPASPAEETVDSTPGGDETILLVEDDDAVRGLVRHYLQGLGYRILSAENGAQALKVCAAVENRIDLLLTDVVMPQMDGRELRKRFLELRPDGRALLMSGYANDTIERQGKLDPSIPLIQKPFTLPSLGSKVRETLDVVGPR